MSLIWKTAGDKTFQCSAYVGAYIDYLYAELARLHPGAHMHIMQTCYHKGVEASAGTHDFDACFDVSFTGLSWTDGVKFLRRHGAAAWFRHTGTWAARDEWHIHFAMIPPGLSTNPTPAGVQAAYNKIGVKVGVYIPGQIDDYYNRAEGLKGQHGYGTDDGYRIGDINRYVFNLQKWETENMEYKDWSEESKDELAKDLWNFKPANVDATMRGLLVALAQKEGIIK